MSAPYTTSDKHLTDFYFQPIAHNSSTSSPWIRRESRIGAAISDTTEDNRYSDIYVAILRWNKATRPEQVAEGLVLVPTEDSPVPDRSTPERFRRIGYFARTMNDPGLSWLDSVPVLQVVVV